MNASSQRPRTGRAETERPETSGHSDARQRLSGRQLAHKEPLPGWASGSWVSDLWVPLLAIAGVTLFSLWNPWNDPDHHQQTRAELLAHYLSHAINSTWVGLSLLMLTVPSVVGALLRLVRARQSTPHNPAPRNRTPRNPATSYTASIWGWRALDAIALDLLIVDELFKRFLPWPRPGREPLMGSGAFPSGHTTFAFLMAYLIWQRYPKLGPLWFSIAALIGWSRIEVHAHYPYQVIAGALLGSGLGALIIWRRNGVFFPRVLLADPFAASTPTPPHASDPNSFEPHSLLHA